MALIIVKILLLSIHLILMNVASAGLLLCVLLEWNSRRVGNLVSNKVGKKLAKETLLSALIGILMGCALVLVLYYTGWERFVSAVDHFWSRIWWGFWEIGFFFVCAGLYLYWWRPVRRRWIWGHRFLAVLAATNFIYHFPPLFTLISEHVPNLQDVSSSTSSEFRQLMFRQHVVAFTSHFGLASIAVSGIRVMQLGVKRLGEEGAVSTIRFGALTALIPTVAQIFVGFWLTISLPNGQAVLGGDPLATSGLFVSVLFAFGLISKLSGVVMGEVEASQIRQSSRLMISVVFLMTATLVLIQQ